MTSYSTSSPQGVANQAIAEALARRQFLFEYRFAGAEWGITIHAANADEARRKIKAVALARYKGEVHATIPVPGFIGRIMAWWKS